MGLSVTTGRIVPMQQLTALNLELPNLSAFKLCPSCSPESIAALCSLALQVPCSVHLCNNIVHLQAIGCK